MQRLLMGEVGSGKTVVALYAMLRAVEHGHQAALMAPTETLAEQHFATIQRLLGGEPVRVRAARRAPPRRDGARDTLGKLASGELSLVVGTHALIEPDVRFARARRGRDRRAAPLRRAPARGARRRRGRAPAAHAAHDRHADPAHARAGALRRPRHERAARAAARPQADRHAPGRRRGGAGAAYEHLRAELRAGRQAYVVCPLIEEADDARSEQAGERGRGDPELRAATAELARLRAGELAGYRARAAPRRRCAPREKQEAMAAFAAGARPGARRDDRDRGRHRRAQRDRDADRERRALRHLPAAPAARARRARRASLALLPRRPARRRRARRGCGRWSSTRDGFRLAEIDLELRKEGELVGHAPVGARGSSGSRGCPRTRSCSSARGRAPRRSSPPTRSCGPRSTRCSPTRSTAHSTDTCCERSGE